MIVQTAAPKGTITLAVFHEVEEQSVSDGEIERQVFETRSQEGRFDEGIVREGE